MDKGGHCLRGGHCFRAEFLIGGLAAEGAVGAVVVVEVFPFLEALVEDLGVVDDDAVEESVELFDVDAVRVVALHQHRPTNRT